MSAASGLSVTSHIARDLLQSAALFQHEHSVVWEYVSNGLEYVDPGMPPTVSVTVDAKEKRITVQDKGRGMTREDLQRYFQMHGENVDRKRGKVGRGMFGTGKSAAFGIGDVLTVTTVRSGLRCKVRLTRKDVEAAVDGSSIPVKVLEDDAPTTEPNGTLVEIERIHIKRMDVGSIVRHIERHIAHWPNATVIVNHQECNAEEPAYSGERRFSTEGTQFEPRLGKVEMIVRIAKAPLDSEWQGIAVLSNNVWHETTLAGCEGKPFANYLFGEMDVPRLSQDTSPISAFNMSRSMRLNPKNELVANILAFIGSNVEGVRRELERSDRERKKQQDAKRLLEEASAIARIINEDFNAWRGQIRRTLAKAQGSSDRFVGAAGGTDTGEALVPGDEIPAIVVEGGGRAGGIGGGTEGRPSSGDGKMLDWTDGEGDTTAAPIKKATPSAFGGFRVEFLPMGQENPRAKYERAERTIYVNLEHPQMAAALKLGVGVEDIAFRRLSYEVAFCEYAIALASELASEDWYQDVTDPIVDIRETINRISKAAASLYAVA